MMQNNIEELYNNYIKESNSDIDIYSFIEIYLKENNSKQYDIDFMKSLIKYNPSFIIYDKTNNEELYREYIDIIISKVEKSNFQYKDGIIKIFKKVIDELDNPNEVKEGKYKIEHKYLFDSLRKRLNSINNIKDITIFEHFNDNFGIGYYQIYDGFFDKEYALKVEEMFNNPDYILLTSAIAKDNIDNVFRNGYYSNYGGDLHRNFWINDTSDLLTLLCGGTYGEERNYSIMAFVPKNAEDIFIYSKDGYENRSLNPKYIYGCIHINRGEEYLPISIEEIENNIPLEERNNESYLKNK